MARLTNCFFSPRWGLRTLVSTKGFDRFLIDILRDQDFIGDQVRFLLVKLTHIGQEILVRIIVVREEIDIPLDQLALTDKEDLHAHPAPCPHNSQRHPGSANPWP